MAIDPERLGAQRLSLLNPPGRETSCARCGRRTRDRTGVCSPCRRSAPDLARMTPEQIAGLMDMCAAELERRRTQLNAMIRERTGR